MTTDTEIIIQIIAAVEKHDCLWNMHSGDYAKRDRLEKAWRDVAQAADKTEAYCRDKWRNVRTGFLRSIKAVNGECDGNSDASRQQRKRFYLYDHMKFLLPTAQSLQSSTRKRRHQQRNESSILPDEFKEETMDESTTNATETSAAAAAADDNLSMAEEKPRPTTLNAADDSNYEEFLKDFHDPLTKGQSEVKPSNQAKPPNESPQKAADNKDITPLTGNNEGNKEYDERAATELMDFFRSNIGDILSLSKPNQRLFKRRMLELVDTLHPDQGS